MSLLGDLVVPVLVSGDHRITGYDPEALERLIAEFNGDVKVAARPPTNPTAPPPGNSLDETNDSVAEPGRELSEGLKNLLERIEAEISYSDSKGQSAFRAGVHDGLRFAEDAIVKLMKHHGFDVASRPTPFDAA